MLAPPGRVPEELRVALRQRVHFDAENIHAFTTSPQTPARATAAWLWLMMMMMHWNPPSLLRLLTQDVFGITHTHALYRRTGQDHQLIDIHTATHLARGRPNRTTGAPSHTAAAHKDMERCSTCAAQRIRADKASSLA
jgi:hypothetical protein